VLLVWRKAWCKLEARLSGLPRNDESPKIDSSALTKGIDFHRRRQKNPDSIPVEKKLSMSDQARSDRINGRACCANRQRFSAPLLLSPAQSLRRN
jgi:hypothetical protein